MKTKVLISYQKNFDDSDSMTSGVDFEFSETIEVSNKEDLFLFLKENLVHAEFLKEFINESVDFSSPIDIYLSHNEGKNWYLETYTLKIKSI